MLIAVNNEEKDEKKKDKTQVVETITINVDPIKILVKKILKTESTMIMNEATKAIKNLSKNEIVI